MNESAHEELLFDEQMGKIDYFSLQSNAYTFVALSGDWLCEEIEETKCFIHFKRHHKARWIDKELCAISPTGDFYVKTSFFEEFNRGEEIED